MYFSGTRIWAQMKTLKSDVSRVCLRVTVVCKTIVPLKKIQKDQSIKVNDWRRSRAADRVTDYHTGCLGSIRSEGLEFLTC